MKQILATLGPSSMHPETIRAMAEAGVTLFRFNLSHMEYADMAPAIEMVQSVTDVPLCIDTEGAQIRNQRMRGGSVHFAEGAAVRIHYDEVEGDAGNISFSPAGIARQFRVGDQVRTDFDLTCFEITACNETYAEARVLHSGEVGSNKAATLNRDIQLPAITEKDRRCVALGRQCGIRRFALSFASSRESIDELRELSGEGAFIISKVESRLGLSHLKDIMQASDAILIDRGDLSREVPLVTIPLLQRRIISMARIHETPAYVATNLLESMISRREPTRAEVNDVVSTILMGADGLVLAAESAVGAYPVLAVDMVQKIIDSCRKWTPNTSIAEVLEMVDDV